MFDQNRLAGFFTLFGAMLLALAASGAFFLYSGILPAYLEIVLPAIIGAGLLTAGIIYKRDNGWGNHQVPPSQGA
jgi:hypothetical protein